MILSDRDIRRAIETGRIKIDPLPELETALGPCSIDFRLGNRFLVFDTTRHPFIDTRQVTLLDGLHREILLEEGNQFILHPGEMVIAHTLERLTLANDLIGRLEGRSSVARIGVVVHSTAARFDPGWDGTPVLELGNLGRMPVAVYSGMRICAFTFEELSTPALRTYRDKPDQKYAGYQGPVATKIFEDQKFTSG